MLRFIYLVLFVFAMGGASAQTGTGWNWSVISNLASNSPGRKIIDIANDAAGNVYATGRFMGTMTLGAYSISTSGDGTVSANYDEDAFIAKWDANGNIQWLQRYGAVGVANNQFGQVITTDANGGVYVGMGNGTSIVVKYDAATGTMLWAQTLTQFEVQAINVGTDGNPVVITSNAGAKDIFKLNSSTGATMWTVNCTGMGSNSTTTYQDFIDAAGNIYFTGFITGAGSVTIAGQTTSVTRLTSFVASIDNNGAFRWVQPMDNVQLQLGFTVDKNGRSYIQFSGGGGGTFQGVSTGSSGGNRYLELNSAGTLERYAFQSPYKGLFRVTDDGIYGFTYENSGFAATLLYGNYYFSLTTTSTMGLGIVIKYDKTDDHVIWANSFEIDGASYNAGKLSTIEIGPGAKVQVGGYFGTFVKFGGTTRTTTIGGGFNQTDFFIAQFDGNSVQPSPTTTWTGAASNNWTDAGNWDNGVPYGAENTIIPAGAPRYPTSIVNTNRTAKLTIQSGVTVSLPLDFSAPAGIINNGVIEVTGTSSSTFQGFNTSQIAPLTGTGRLLFTANSPSSIYYDLTTNGLEVNRVGGILSYGGIVGGNLVLTNGILQAGFPVVMSNPNATVSYTNTSYVTGTLKRAVNASGLYEFPVGSASNLNVASVNLSNITGPQYISASFSTSSPGTVNTTAGGVPVTAALNNGFWTITPDIALTGGSYTVTLTAKAASNMVSNAARYVVIKRTNSAGAWGFFGSNGVASQTVNTATAVAGNITGFSDFAVGIATGTVNAILPLRFLSFTATRMNKQVQLKWSTAEEHGADRFDVEHSMDGNTWTKVGTVAAKNGTGINNYDFIYPNAVSGLHFFRLKQVDADSRFVYSAVAAVKLEADAAITLFPNPVVNEINLVFKNNLTGTVSYAIVDGKGTQVMTGIINSQETKIKLPALSAGQYWIRLSNGSVLSFVK